MGGRGFRTVKVQVGKLNNIKYVVASKGFQKLTLHFLLFFLLFFIIIVSMSLSFVCMPFFFLSSIISQFVEVICRPWYISMFRELSRTYNTSFLPISKYFRVDMKGSAAEGHWGTVRGSSLTSIFCSGTIHHEVEQCPVSRPPALSSTLGNDFNDLEFHFANGQNGDFQCKTVGAAPFLFLFWRL